jgi:ribosome-binding protein aMBF1 (putative translation factor)
MANGIEAEITAIQAGSAHTMTWLRGDYLPSPLPKAVEDRLATLISRFDAPRELARTGRAPRRSPAPETKKLSPDSVVSRLLEGENPIRVWRQHRGLSLRSLAEQVATSPSALSDIESGKSEGRLSILHWIAGALDVGLEDLIPAAGRVADDASGRQQGTVEPR